MNGPGETPPPRRVVVTGSESSGKTTLARAIAERLAVPWSPEFAREYALRAGRPLLVGDVAAIAEGQERLERLAYDAARAARATVVVHDTDLVSTLVYARHYYGDAPAALVARVQERRADLYLLCEPDLPWIADGVRDHPHARSAVHTAFDATLRALGARVVPIAGTGAARLHAALAAITSGR